MDGYLKSRVVINGTKVNLVIVFLAELPDC